MPFETLNFVQVGERSRYTRRSNYKMVITCRFTHGFKNYLSQLFIWNICIGRLKVKVPLEGQMIKWSYIELVWAIMQFYSYSCIPK